MGSYHQFYQAFGRPDSHPLGKAGRIWKPTADRLKMAGKD